MLFDRFDEYSNVRGNMTVLILVPARSSFINDFKTVTLDFVKNIEAKKKKKKSKHHPIQCVKIFLKSMKNIYYYISKKKKYSCIQGNHHHHYHKLTNSIRRHVYTFTRDLSGIYSINLRPLDFVPTRIVSTSS